MKTKKLVAKGLEVVDVKQVMHLMLILLKQSNSTPNDKMKGKIVDVLEKDTNWRKNIRFPKVVIGQ
jgi:hypothetical protein